MARLLKVLAFLFVLPAFASTGNWNGVSFTALNGVAQTSWNGTGISCASGAGPAVIMANVTSAQGPTSGVTITQAVDCTGATCLMSDGTFFPLGTQTGESATYDGVAMTEEATVDPFAGTVVKMARFILKSPHSGVHNVVITITGTTLTKSEIGCVPLSGVNTTTATGTTVTANDTTGTSGTATATVTSATGELVIAGVLVNNAPTLTPGAGQTALYSVINPAAEVLSATSKAGAASVVSLWTFTPNIWFVISTPFKP